MAIQIESLEVEIRQKSNQASRALGRLTETMRHLKDVCGPTVETLKSLTSTLDDISTKAGGAATGLSAISKAAGKTAKNVKKQFTEARSEYDKMIETMRRPRLEQHDVNFVFGENPKQSRTATPLLPDNSIIDTTYRELNVVDDSPIKAYIERSKEAASQSVKLSTALKGLLTQFRRIVAYRIIRFAFQALINTIRHGVKNAYEFSRIMGGEFVGTMNQLSSKWLQLKNQVGSFFSETIIMLSPFLDKVMNKIIDVMNRLSEAMAYLNGDTVYKRAKYLEQEWQDATDAAKKYKTQLLGIDEINNLTSRSGDNTPDYGEMFEYVKVSLSEQNKGITFLRDNLEQILDLVKTVGASLLVWKLSNSFLTGVFRVWDFVKTLKTPIAITASFAGFFVEYNAFKSMGQNGASIWNVLGATLGTSLGIGAAYLAMGPNSLILTVPIALALAFKGYSAGIKSAAAANSIGQEIQRIKEQLDKDGSLNVELKLKIAENYNVLTDAASDLQKVYNLIERAYALNGDQSAVSELTALVEAINAYDIEGIELDLDPNNQLTNVKEDLDAIVKDLLVIRLRDEAIKNLSDVGYNKSVAEANNASSYQAMKDAEQALQDAKEYWQAVMETQITWDPWGTKSKEKQRNEKIAKENWVEAKRIFEEAQAQYDETSKTLEEANAQYDYYLGVINNTVDVVEDMLKPTHDTTNAFEEQAESIGHVNEALEEYKSTMENINTHPVLDFFKKTFSSFVPSKIVNIGGTYASGGYPEQGQLFIANEAGPEMVGSIGSRTAVANNDQITSAIAAATYSAMSQALSENNGHVTIQVEGDPSGMFRVMQKQAKNYSMRTGNLAFE